jgi:hypothetical protein
VRSAGVPHSAPGSLDPSEPTIPTFREPGLCAIGIELHQDRAFNEETGKSNLVFLFSASRR